MTNLSKTFAYVGDDLQLVDNIILNLAKNEVELIPIITEYLVKNGGKRIRPLITLLLAKSLKADIKKSAKLAAAVELIHTATLLHDDVIDNGQTRRGAKTVNLIWGNKEAILVGDFLLSQAFCLMVESGSMEALGLLAKTAKTITEAEIWQLELLFDYELAIEKYLHLIKGKTAALFAAAAAVIPTLINKSKSECDAVYKVFELVGIIFQIIDDILDYESENDVLGKEANHDITEGKITLPLIVAMQNATNETKQQIKILLDQINSGDIDKSKDLYLLVKNNNGVQLAKDYLKSYIHKLKQEKEKLSFLPSELFDEVVNYNLSRLY